MSTLKLSYLVLAGVYVWLFFWGGGQRKVLGLGGDCSTEPLVKNLLFFFFFSQSEMQNWISPLS